MSHKEITSASWCTYYDFNEENVVEVPQELITWLNFLLNRDDEATVAAFIWDYQSLTDEGGPELQMFPDKDSLVEGDIITLNFVTEFEAICGGTMFDEYSHHWILTECAGVVKVSPKEMTNWLGNKGKEVCPQTLIRNVLNVEPKHWGTTVSRLQEGANK